MSGDAARDPEVYAAAHAILSARALSKEVLWQGPATRRWQRVTAWGSVDLPAVRQLCTGVCVMGALVLAADQLGYPPNDWWAMTQAAKQMMDTPTSPNWWNNQHGTTKEQVLAALAVGAARTPEWVAECVT